MFKNRRQISDLSVEMGLERRQTVSFLPMSDYGDWFEAIRNDDSETVDMTLTLAEEGEKNRLLNGRLQFFDIAAIKNVNAQNCSFTYPLILAASFGSLKTFDVLIDHGVDIFALEDDECNLFHSLICVAFYEPNQEDDVIMTYKHVCQSLKAKDLKRLLEMQNSGGFRPLEFAVQQGTLKLMSAILDTPDVYMIREEVVDVTAYQWYDITEYVFDARKFVSPLFLMMSLDQRNINQANQLFCDGIFKDWAERYMRSNRLLFAICFLMRLLYISMLYVYEMDRIWLTNIGGIGDDDLKSLKAEMNTSSVNASFVFCQEFGTIKMPPILRVVIFGYLLFYSIAGLLLDFYRMLFYFLRLPQVFTARSNLSGRKRIMITRWNTFDRGCNLIFSVLVIAELLILNEITQRDYLLVVIDIFRLLLTLTSLWNLMVYLQILPGIGQVVIYIREMTPDLASFIVMFCFYTAIFARQFILFFNVNSKQGCIRDFSSFPMALYSLYLTMLNMEDFTQFDVYAREILYIHHFAYVAVVGIMLLNLLIAVFSNTLSKVKEEKEFTIYLSRLNVICFQHYGLSIVPVLSWIYTPIYRATVRKHFVCEGDRVYLVNAKNIDHRSEINVTV